jgi:flagellar biosynthesis protein FlhA
VIRYADIAVAVFVGLVALLLVLPVPAYLIDVLVVFNIGVAILLLLAGLYVSSSVSLLAFPTILLLTTLLRLSVNVASTRLILTNGYAGQVIESFGQFLIRLCCYLNCNCKRCGKSFRGSRSIYP